MKAAGICVLLFLSLVYFGYAGLHAYHWNVEAKDWVNAQGMYRFSDTTQGRHFTRYAVAHYQYSGQAYAPRVRLSKDQLNTSSMNQDERSLLMKIDPKHPERFFLDPSEVIKSNIEGGILWMVVLVLWYLLFDRFEPMIAKINSQKSSTATK